MQFISTILQTFIMQIISTKPLCNYNVPVITTTTKNFTFCPGKSQENFPNFFQDFPGLINKIQGLSRTFQDRKKNPGLFQNVATLSNCINKGFCVSSMFCWCNFHSCSDSCWDFKMSDGIKTSSRTLSL